jgi:trehalose 6-phosphate phosphatase
MMADERVQLAHAIAPVVDACVEVLSQTPAALVTDIDGTISAIAPTPFEAVVDPVALDALAQLTERLAVVAVISGRAPGDGARMVGLPDLIYVGNHGLERIVRGLPWTHPAADAAREAIAAALAEIEAEVRTQDEAPWLLVENKGVTGTVHYRLAPDHAVAAAMLEPVAAVAAERYGLHVSPGRMIVELRPAVAINKGTAIRDLATELALRGMVFLGDDITDIDGFRALRALREERAAATLSVGVLGPESAAVIAAESDFHVDGVTACAATLLAIASRLAPRQPREAVGIGELAGAILERDTAPGDLPDGTYQGDGR